MTPEMRDSIMARQGAECLVPDCPDPWVDGAHIEPSGAGGRPSTYTPKNIIGLCRFHHDVFDGRELHGRQRLLRVLMRSLADRVAADRVLLSS